MSFLNRLTQRSSLNQYASVIEQILMSGSNMLASIVVLKVADVANFGIYSFIFVLATLVGGVFGTLLHRQMMLQISSEDESVQRRVFLATVTIELIGLLIFLILITLSLAVLSIWFDIQSHQKLIVASLVYVMLLVLFDAFKQFSYTTENQVYSLRSTCIYVVVQLLLMGLIVWLMTGTDVVAAVYAALSAGLSISLMANKLCRTALLQAQWLHWPYVWEVLTGFFKQGRFSLLGMAITWAQNQSMNPFLMLISGPTVAGYFSLGRLMIMPMAVVSQGLVNSSTPTLRKLYKSDGRTIIGNPHNLVYKENLFVLVALRCLVAHRTLFRAV